MERHNRQSGLRFSLRSLFVVFTVITVLCSGAFLVYRKFDQTVKDPYRVWHTADLLVDYMRANGDAWPNDWEDIRLYMEKHPTQRVGVESIEEVKRHIEIDFSFDPSEVDISTTFDEDAPQFRAVWLRNGSTARYVGCGPNEIIHRYLKGQAERRTAANKKPLRQ